MIPNLIAIANGKGGCGKTTLAANLAGYAALAGWKVLLVELDPQGNLGLDLGAKQLWDDDGGERFYDLVARGRSVEPLKDIRENLDVLPAGLETANAENALRDNEQLLNKALAPLATDYHLLIADCPPQTSSPLVRAVLAAAHFLLIPTFRDPASLEGLEKIAEEFVRARNQGNPDLQLLGVALLNHSPRSVALRENREVIEAALADAGAPVFSAIVRENAHAAEHARKIGKLMYEYEDAAKNAEPFWTELRSGEKRQSKRTWSKSASKLAEDFQQLSAEILGQYTERLSETSEVAS